MRIRKEFLPVCVPYIEEEILMSAGFQKMETISIITVCRGQRFDRDLSSISRNVAVVRRLVKEDQTFGTQYMEVKSYATSQAL